MTNSVLELSKEISEMLQETNVVKRFQQAEEQVNKSEAVNNYIVEIKRLQKELVHAKHYQKHNYIKRLEKELDFIEKEFYNLPIVLEYKRYQLEVNGLLQLVNRTLLDSLSEEIKIDTTYTPEGGCSTGGKCGC